MQVLGFPLESPQAVVGRAASDLAAIARMARAAPAQLDRILELGEEMAEIGRGVLEIAERLDQRADAALALGERLDARAAELLKLGRKMEKLGRRVDKRGAEIVNRSDELVASAATVAETGSELIATLPTLERAIEMASPLEGAIDRVGRLVDRLPGGTARRTAAQIEADATAQFEAKATEIIAKAETETETETETTDSPEGLDQVDG
jgi:glycerol-3-phosphate dehydrogenase